MCTVFLSFENVVNMFFFTVSKLLLKHVFNKKTLIANFNYLTITI